MSLSTQLLHVFLRAPLHPRSHFILVHFFTQLFSSLRSTCPNHLNLALWILSSTHSMPKRLNSSSLFYPLKTLHTSFVPSSSQPSQPIQVLRIHSPHLATICIPTLSEHVQASYIFPFSYKKTPPLSKLVLAH